MITEKNNVFYCNCGFSFQRGHSGSHDCADGLRNKLADSEARCAALAAENAALKELIEQHANSVAVCPNCSHEEPSETDDIVALYRSLETPATDAFLAEVRAQGVEMFATKAAEDLRTAGGAWGVIQEPYHEVADYLEDRGESFAAQLRKEAAQ